MDRNEEIRQIAHQLWEEEGRPEGRGEAHWLRAETIWLEKHAKPAPTVAPSTPAPPKVEQKKTRPKKRAK